MRLALTLFFLMVVASAAFPQAPSGNLFANTRPDVSIVVRKTANGADSVEVSMVEPNYPPELLSRQIAAVGQAMGAVPTALRLERNEIDGNKGLVYLQGLFTLTGLIDPATGILRVEPFAKGFAGGPKEHSVSVLMLTFEGVVPTENTLRAFFPEDGSVRVQAAAMKPAGVEYRVQLLTQDPQAIHIPDAKKLPETGKTPSAPKSAGLDWPLLGAIFAAAIAAGALVYSLLLRARPKDPRTRRV